MNHYLDAFEALGVSDQARLDAIARFKELGFPTVKQEEWRFTNLATLAKSTFELSRPGTNGVTNGVTSDDVARLGCAPGLVFVDGHYRADLSVASKGVSIREHMKPRDYSDAPALSALNGAFAEDGVFLVVQGEIAEPIHVLFVGTDKVSHPLNAYVVERNAKAHVVETYVSLGETAHWTNAVTHIKLAENAQFEHTRLQLENEQSYNTSNVHIHQARDSRYVSHVATLGGKLVRNDIVAALDDENCAATLNGVVLTRGEQHVDNYTVLEHRKPHCESHELYKSILDDRSTGVFTGYIHVFEDAQKTDAYQSSSALLLSDEAVMDSKPCLEIYADDVKCSHGSTIGQLDKDALFYLRTRGIPKQQAYHMLIRAFAEDVTNRIGVAEVREKVESLIAARLPGDE